MSADYLRETAAEIEKLTKDGFRHYDHEHLRPGNRVRNAGERYDTARQFGTAEIVAVLRKPGLWERTWGRLNIEVLVKRDRDGSLCWWADYGTVLPEGCWLCGGAGCLRCTDLAVARSWRGES